MTASIHQLPAPLYPEHLSPVFNWPAVGGPLAASPTGDARLNIDRLMQDMRAAWDWAMANHVAVLSIDADRNGAYLRLAPSPRLRTLFGEECACIHSFPSHGLQVQRWIGTVGQNVRAFWQEVTCVH